MDMWWLFTRTHLVRCWAEAIHEPHLEKLKPASYLPCFPKSLKLRYVQYKAIKKQFDCKKNSSKQHTLSTVVMPAKRENWFNAGNRTRQSTKEKQRFGFHSLTTEAIKKASKNATCLQVRIICIMRLFQRAIGIVARKNATRLYTLTGDTNNNCMCRSSNTNIGNDC